MSDGKAGLLKLQNRFYPSPRVGDKVSKAVMLAMLFIGSTVSLFVLSSSQNLFTLLMTGFFVLLTLVTLVAVVEMRQFWYRFGEMPLMLDPLPGSIGGQVGGQIRLCSPPKQGRCSVVLSCVYRDSYARKDKHRESLIWQQESVAQYANLPSGGALLFCFDVPDDLPASEGKPDADAPYVWRLVAKMGEGTLILGGQEGNCVYEIPVQPPRQLSSIHPDDWVRPSAGSLPVLTPAQCAAAGFPAGVSVVRYRMLGDQFIPAALMLFVGLMALAWAVLATDTTLMGMVSRFFLGGIGMFFLWICVTLLFSSLTVVLDGSKVSVKHAVLGWTTDFRTIPCSSIVRIQMQDSGHSRYMRQNGQELPSYRIVAILTNGSSLYLTKVIEGEVAAGQAVAYFQAAMMPSLPGRPLT